MSPRVPDCAGHPNADFALLPRILTATSPNGFASLVLVNRKWRAVSQRGYLYLHHLAQCPSFAASHPTLPSADDDNLPSLRRLFSREVKRNLFDAFLRPRQTIIKLVSNSISSSSCPGGEGLFFSASPRSQLLLAYNSSRIYVIDARGDSAELKREFKILRRPVAVCIKDDASLLAVLSSEMQVDLYDLGTSPPRRKQAIILDNTPRTIALSPCGSVLAAAYEGGIEVSSLNPGAIASDKRSVKCDAVDSLAFSNDGTQILGTTTHSSPPNTVILTAPYYDPGSMQDDGSSISAMWTTSILFPNSSRDCSHAVLLQDGSQEEASWTFAYDRSFQTFRAVRIDDLRNGTTYFTGPVPREASQVKMLPSTLSGTTYNGQLVAAGFHGKEVWVYGIPEDLDAVPEAASSGSDKNSSSTGLGRHNSERSSVSRNPSSRGRDAGDGRVPEWQLLGDKLRNTLVPGSKIAEVSGVTNVKWVANFGDSSLKERLLITAKGVLGPRLVTEEEDIDFVDGGRIALVDFDYSFEDGEKTEITIEVGTDEAETLEEERRDIETEVAIVRRRTVAQRGGGRSALLRAATRSSRDLAASVPAVPVSSAEGADGDDDDPLLPRRIGPRPAKNASAVDTADDPDVATIEEQEAMDAPYAHASPRTAPTLRRAATAAAVNQRLNPRLADGRPIEYRRADGRREHPHESDADNWVPPPPPYQKEDPGDLPAFLRGPAVRPMNGPPVPPLPSVAGVAADRSRGLPPLPPYVTSGEALRSPPSPSNRTAGHQRTASDSTTLSRPRTEDAPRPMSSPSGYVEMDDLYDVTPPESPRVRASVPSLQREAQEAPNPTPGSADPSHHSTSQPSRAPPPQQPSVDAQVSAPSQPTLGFHLPQPSAPPVASSSINQPTIRRLSNAQTWPAGPGQNPAHPVGHAPGFPGDALLPPPPSSDQVASLGHRIRQGNPPQLSGGFHSPYSAYTGHNGEPSSPQQTRPVTAGPLGTWGSTNDLPLIISTPKGVSGAFDPPDRRASNRGSETPIVAPVPRHPQPTRGSGARPTVERLETIYSTGPPERESRRPKTQFGRGLLAPWRRSPSVSPGTVPVGIGRQTSRAERSAAKNMKDARKKGWDLSLIHI